MDNIQPTEYWLTSETHKVLLFATADKFSQRKASTTRTEGLLWVKAKTGDWIQYRAIGSCVFNRCSKIEKGGRCPFAPLVVLILEKPYLEMCGFALQKDSYLLFCSK